MKKGFCFIFILALVLGMLSQANALSPPWWRAHQQLIYSIGLDSRLVIDEPIEPGEANGNTINIHATNEDYFGLALRILLKEQLEGTNIVVLDINDGSEIVFPDFDYTPELIQLAMDIVFEWNQYVHTTEIMRTPAGDIVQLITEMAAIQFYTDYLTQFYGRSTYIAEELLCMVMKDSIDDIPIHCSTRYYVSPFPNW